MRKGGDIGTDLEEPGEEHFSLQELTVQRPCGRSAGKAEGGVAVVRQWEENQCLMRSTC